MGSNEEIVNLQYRQYPLVLEEGKQQPINNFCSSVPASYICLNEHSTNKSFSNPARKLRFIPLNLDRPPPFLLTTGLQVSVDGEGIGATGCAFYHVRGLKFVEARVGRESTSCQTPNWMCPVDRGHRPIARDYC